MIGAVLALWVSAPCPLDVSGLPPRLGAALRSAAADRARRGGRLDEAHACAEAALELDSADPTGVQHLDRARIAADAGELDEAAVELERALAAGAPADEVLPLLAQVHSGRGDRARALDATLRAGTPQARLWAAALGEPGSSRWAATQRDRKDLTGAMSLLAMAHHARADARTSLAVGLAREAESTAQQGGVGALAREARLLLRALENDRAWSFGGSGRVFGEAFSNPAIAGSLGDASGFVGLEAGLVATGQARGVRGRLDGRLGALAEASDRPGTHLGGVFAVGHLTLDLVVGGHPGAAVVQLDARVTTRWVEGFDQRLGALLEIGPSVWVPFSRGWWVGVGAYGLRLDVDDPFSPESLVSRRNRDVVAQRGVVTVMRRGPSASFRFSGFFANEQADGAAFDAVGGGGALSLWVEATPGVWLGTGGSSVVRDFGPEDPAPVLGRADSVLETRVVAWLGSTVRLSRDLRLRLDGRVVRAHREDAAPDYGWAAGRLGLEAQW